MAVPTPDLRRAEVEQAVKSAADQMRSEGVQPRDSVEQLSWPCFLEPFDDTETARAQEGQVASASEQTAAEPHVRAFAGDL